MKPRVRKPRSKVTELIRAYEDLEAMLKKLKASVPRGVMNLPIDVRKLIAQLSRSKRRLERKIGNTLLLEKEHLTTRLKGIASQLRHQEN